MNSPNLSDDIYDALVYYTTEWYSSQLIDRFSDLLLRLPICRKPWYVIKFTSSFFIWWGRPKIYTHNEVLVALKKKIINACLYNAFNGDVFLEERIMTYNYFQRNDLAFILSNIPREGEGRILCPDMIVIRHGINQYYRRIIMKNYSSCFVGLFTAFLLAGCLLSRSTEETFGDGMPGLLHANWTAFQLVWLFDSATPVYGTSIGVYDGFENSVGIFTSALGCNFSGDNYGIGTGFATGIDDGSLTGISCDFMHIGSLGFSQGKAGWLHGLGVDVVSIARRVDGVVVNIVPIWLVTHGVAVAVWFPPYNDVCGVQIGAVAQGGVDGVQIGFVTDNAPWNNGNDAAGYSGCVSVGAVNFTVVDGWQFGIFNSASSGSEVTQVGILNHNEIGFFPWMPIINWSRPQQH